MPFTALIPPSSGCARKIAQGPTIAPRQDRCTIAEIRLGVKGIDRRDIPPIAAAPTLSGWVKTNSIPTVFVGIQC